MTFLQLSKVFLVLSGLAILASIVLFITPGPKFSIEFTGGTLMEVRLPEGKTKEELNTVLQNYAKKAGSLGNYTISALNGAAGHSFLMRMRDLTNEEHVALKSQMDKTFGNVQELQYTTIGPSLSASLKQNSFIALAVASVAIIAYLAFAFRKLPRKLSPWKFGVLAVVAFIHDVIITAGVFIVLGRFTTFEFDPLFVTALLTILAYSANDTIVIFDRIRANLSYENRSESFETTVTRALKQSVTRTLNTAIAALIMLFAIFFMGSQSIRWFILALIAGTVIGAYSSYFIACPLLIFWRKKGN